MTTSRPITPSNHNADEPGNDAESIGARIRSLRRQQDISLSELAVRAGVSKSYLSTVENGTGKRPGAAVLHKVAVALEVTLADLLGRTVSTTGNRPDEVPPSLRAFAAQRQLPQADVDMLAGIKFRGEAPRSPDRWQFIYDAIVMSVRTESADE